MESPVLKPDAQRALANVETFGKSMEDFDVATMATDSVIDDVSTTLIPDDQVNLAMQKMIDEHSLEVSSSFPAAFRDEADKRRIEQLQRDLPTVPASSAAMANS